MSKFYLILLGVLFCASSIRSQPSEPLEAVIDSLELDRIVITASKIPTTQRETAKPVLIIDRQEIESSGGRDLAQILNQQSGIRVSDSYGAPSNSKSLFMQGASSQYTLVLIDGLALKDPSGIGGTFDLRLLPLNNVERIEVLKGSQSTLYGSDAIAGVINIITKKGEEKPFNTTGQLSYGTYNSFQGSVGMHGSLNESVRYSFSYNRESSDGFSAAKDPADSGTFGDDGFRLNSYYWRIDLKPFEALTISPFLNYSGYRGDYDADAFQDADNEFTSTLLNPGIQFEYLPRSLRLNGGYTYSRTERAFESEFGINEFEGRLHNADFFGSYQLSSHLQFLAGVNYQETIIPEHITDSEKLSAETVSPYATLVLKNLYGFNTELGYRLNSHSEFGSNSTFSFSPSFNITENIKLFASASTGFKAPTLDELFGPFGANPDLDPQKSRYINAGAETYLLNQSLKLSALWFDRKIDDLIIYAAQGYVNRDRQEDNGVELTASWLATSRLRMGAFYNYVTGETITIDEEGVESRSDNLIRRPAHSFGINAGLQITDRFNIRVDAEHNGERTDLFFNPDNNFAQEEITLDPYLLVNLYAGYRVLNDQLTLFADVRNLLNTDFTEVYGYNTTGFAIKGGLRFNL